MVSYIIYYGIPPERVRGSTIEMEDVVVVTKDDKGKVKLHQALNLTAQSLWSLEARRSQSIFSLFLNPINQEKAYGQIPD